MKKIKNKTLDIEINGIQMNTGQNTIEYIISTSINDVISAVNIFPFINNQITLNNERFTYSSVLHIEDLQNILLNNIIEQTDLWITGREIINNFSTHIIWLTNKLELNLDDWELINN